MAPCKNCFLFDEEKLENACCFFTERHWLAFSLLNVVLNIQKMWLQFVYPAKQIFAIETINMSFTKTV